MKKKNTIKNNIDTNVLIKKLDNLTTVVNKLTDKVEVEKKRNEKLTNIIKNINKPKLNKKDKKKVATTKVIKILKDGRRTEVLANNILQEIMNRFWPKYIAYLKRSDVVKYNKIEDLEEQSRIHYISLVLPVHAMGNSLSMQSNKTFFGYDSVPIIIEKTTNAKDLKIELYVVLKRLIDGISYDRGKILSKLQSNIASLELTPEKRREISLLLDSEIQK